MTMSGVVSLAAVVIVAVLIFLGLFEPTGAYRARRPAARIDSREFVNYLSAIVNAPCPPIECPNMPVRAGSTENVAATNSNSSFVM